MSAVHLLCELASINTNKLSLMSTVLNDYGITSTCIIILVCIHAFGSPGSIISDQLGIGSLLIVYANVFSGTPSVQRFS